MNRRALVKKIRSEARRQGVLWTLDRKGAAHDLYRLEETMIPIPRHTEIGPGLTEAILKQCEPQLGPRWWR